MKTILLMDIVITFFGVYLGVNAVKMKSSGKISSLVVPEEEIGRCRNVTAYIAEIFPFMIFFAIIATVVGAIGILYDVKIIHPGRLWSFMELGLFLIALAVFVYGMRHTKSKYF